MEQQSRVQAVEEAVLEHELLARTSFFGGRAKEYDLACPRIPDGGQRDRRADAACRHRVVAATVPEPRQRVVLSEDADFGGGGAPGALPATVQRSPDCGFQATGRVLDGIAV